MSMSATVQPDSDIHISRVDQTKINEFARLNARCDDIKDEMKAKQNLLQNLSDAADEVMVNCEESDLVPYAFGEVFIHCSQDETLALLDKDKDKLQKEIDGMKGEVETLAERMSELKTYLYAKFGDNINLEADPDDD